MNSRLKLLLALGSSALVLSGCASISERKRHQYVYIQSTPPGALIFDRGRNIGTTPSLVRLKRESDRLLTLEMAGEEKYLELETKYSWTESFAENFIFGGLAPLGWLTDLATGAAYRYQDPKTVLFKAAPTKPKLQRLILAPPLARTFDLSDEAANYWGEQLAKQNADTQVVPYKESLSVFHDSGIDYDENSNDEQRYRHVLFNLKADRIFTSEVIEDQGGIRLKGELKDIAGMVSEKKVGEIVSTKPTSWKGSAFGAIPSWFHFMPNTGGLEFSNAAINLKEEGRNENYVGVETGGKATLGVFSYLQAVSLSHLQVPRFDRTPHWKFQFTPSVRFSYKTIFFPNYSKLAQVNFDFLQFGAGIGPEFGYQFGKHFTYFKYVPLWTYLQIEWIQPGGPSERKAAGALDGTTEMGYLYFVNIRMSIRLFVKSTSSNIDLWNSVAQRVNPTTPPMAYVTDSYSGIVIGYTFDLHDR